MIRPTYGKDHRFNAQCTVTNFLSYTTTTKIRVNIRFSNELFQRKLSNIFIENKKSDFP